MSISKKYQKVSANMSKECKEKKKFITNRNSLTQEGQISWKNKVMAKYHISEEENNSLTQDNKINLTNIPALKMKKFTFKERRWRWTRSNFEIITNIKININTNTKC